MDYGINGIFQWNLFEKKKNSLLGLKRVIKSVWSGLSQELIDNTPKSWLKQVFFMIEPGGLHVESKLNSGK